MFINHPTNHTKASRTCESTELSSVSRQNFEGKINKARLKLIPMAVLALCKVKRTFNSPMQHLLAKYDKKPEPG